MKIVPHGNRIVVRRAEPPKTTEGGLHIPDVARDGRETPREVEMEPHRGEVITVGAGEWTVTAEGRMHLQPIPLKPGEVVVWQKYSGQIVTLGSERFYILSYDEILGTLEP